MKTLKILALCSVILTVAACASKAPEPVQVPVAQWAEPRIVGLTALAEAEGFELERDGDQIRIIIPINGNFHPKRTLLLPSGLVPISKVAKALKNDSGSQFVVVGHSDSAGDKELNAQQSLERAQQVVNILMLGGVSRQRLQLVSMGENEPRADNGTETGRDLNRRVEIVMTPYPTTTSVAMAK
ncbi:MAG TPA: OmpA family protein [Pseudomonas xinjiangensis]|uniref:OmpA family protein n=2 Tax=root TaxID=1 RepID=A0A7V1BM77_9GAMM|nr:OmpA family protein [Halopseudomonas xinjiangensis]HEC46803.1 OmpA family protein [Halopseudomonas xinjiangensis]